MTEAPLNIDCFANIEAQHDPRYRFKASKVRDIIAEVNGSKYGNGGIFNPQRVHMRVHQTYFRFCDSKSRNATGNWWIDGETFVYLQQFAKQHKHVASYARKTDVNALAYAAKLHLAVPFEWGDTDYVVEAELIKRMDAYTGRGNIAFLDKQDERDGGAKYIPIRQDLMQLYVPDMRVHFTSCMRILRKGNAAWF